MKLSILKGSENYVASVVKVEIILDIRDADRIKTTIVNGNPVIVSTLVNVGDNMLYFVSGTKLSEKYCHINNLFDKPELNFDKTQKGFISSKCRVKAIKLKGAMSDGILMPLDSVSYVKNFDESELSYNTEFSQIGDEVICMKYFVEQSITLNGSGKYPKVNNLNNILIGGQFKFHFQTAPLAKNCHKVSLTDYVIITSKFHGSSVILSKVFIKKQLTVMEKLFKMLRLPVREKEYGYIFSSGKPRNEMIKGVLDNYLNPAQGYYKENIWKLVCQDYKYALEDGITIYGEVCNSNIQKGYDYAKLRNSKYNYTFVVYRITRTNEFGNVDEFAWNQVEKYCMKYNLHTVPVYFKGKLNEFIKDNRDIVEVLSEKFLEKTCEFCENNVPNEGICLRLESGDFDIFKLKSNKFKLMEDKLQESGEINIEDAE